MTRSSSQDPRFRESERAHRAATGSAKAVAHGAALRGHPGLLALAESPGEQARVEAFAQDLAEWFAGGDRRRLAPLARVVTQVARLELRDPAAICRGDPTLSVEAAVEATRTLWPWIRDIEPEVPEHLQVDLGEEGAGEGAGGASPGAGGEAEGDGEGEGEGDGEGSGGDEGDAEGEDDAEGDGDLAGRVRERLGSLEAGEVSQPAVEAAQRAARLVQGLERLLPGVGWSVAPGRLRELLLGDLERTGRLLAKLSEIEAVVQALGRIEASRRRAGPRHGGGEEVVGVHLSGEVARALPGELGLLGDPGTEDLFYARWSERRLLSLELAGAGLDGSSDGGEKGPVIACIDASASMDGEPERLAKAIVLALCKIALPAGRVVHLLLFGGRGQHLEVRLRKGEASWGHLLDLLSRSFDGGTDFDGPLLRALELLDEQELVGADIFVVTDGQCYTSSYVERKVQEARRARGIRVVTALVGARFLDGVRGFSDEVVDWADVGRAVHRPRAG